MVILFAFGLGCREELPEFIVNNNSITLGSQEFTEDEFFEKIKNLNSKHQVTCDVFDVESSNYIYDHFHPKLLSKIKSNVKLKSLLDIQIIEE